MKTMKDITVHSMALFATEAVALRDARYPYSFGDRSEHLSDAAKAVAAKHGLDEKCQHFIFVLAFSANNEIHDYADENK